MLVQRTIMPCPKRGGIETRCWCSGRPGNSPAEVACGRQPELAACAANMGHLSALPSAHVLLTCTSVLYRRNEYFIETGQRHYYFMNVGNGEVIDASRRVSCLLLVLAGCFLLAVGAVMGVASAVCSRASQPASSDSQHCRCWCRCRCRCRISALGEPASQVPLRTHGAAHTSRASFLHVHCCPVSAGQPGAIHQPQL